MNYNRSKVNKFIVEHFDDNELRILCAVEFRDVYADFSDAWGKKRKVIELLGWCERNAQQDKLLAVLLRERPKPFRKIFGRTIAEHAAVNVRVGERNPRQIFISHAHQDAALAHKLTADLRANGWQIWIAPDSVQSCRVPGRRRSKLQVQLFWSLGCRTPFHFWLLISAF